MLAVLWVGSIAVLLALITLLTVSADHKGASAAAMKEESKTDAGASPPEDTDPHGILGVDPASHSRKGLAHRQLLEFLNLAGEKVSLAIITANGYQFCFRECSTMEILTPIPVCIRLFASHEAYNHVVIVDLSMNLLHRKLVRTGGHRKRRQRFNNLRSSGQSFSILYISNPFTA